MISVIYCGAIFTLFIVLKSINQALHRMFDTAVCIHEAVAEDELPESQKKRTHSLQANTILYVP